MICSGKVLKYCFKNDELNIDIDIEESLLI